MSTITSGTITAFYLFDVGDVITLTAGADRFAVTAPSRFAFKQPSPAYVQYRESPIIVDGSAIGMGTVGDYAVRVKAFDYGVVSVALTCGMPSDWDALLAQGILWSSLAFIFGPLAERVLATEPATSLPVGGSVGAAA